MPRTPITNLAVGWRDTTGHDDLVLAEGRADLATALRVVKRRAVMPQRGDGSRMRADELPVGDIDALIVTLRVERMGDRLIAEGSCGHCSAMVDVDFGLAAYLAHRRPRRSRLAIPDDEAGWWRLLRFDTTFRLPSAGEVIAAGDVVNHPGGGRSALLAACVRGDLSANAVRAAERAMTVLAPILRTTVSGACPECGAVVDLDVDARGLCLAELGFLAGSVLDEVHLLASAYHWRERDILDLPSTRRTAYAERIRLSQTTSTSVEVAGS
jgi:hypothetical protein